jgi:hypothetical protein
MVVTHPMSFVMGGLRDNLKPSDMWAKFTGDYVILCVALYRRTADPEDLRRTIQSARFLIQCQSHNYATKYNDSLEHWSEGDFDSGKKTHR